jgi:hypothetical protein
MHIVTTTFFAPRRLPSINAWPVRRDPVMWYGLQIAAVEHLHGEGFV